MEWIVDESRKEQVQSEGMMGKDQILYHEDCWGEFPSVVLMCVS